MLTMMKNQMMENDTGFGMSKRFGAVKKGSNLLSTTSKACVIEFLNEGDEYYMVIDSKKERTEINMKHIDQLAEKDNGDLKMVYFIPVQDEASKNKGKFEKIKAEFECCENTILLKTF